MRIAAIVSIKEDNLTHEQIGNTGIVANGVAGVVENKNVADFATKQPHDSSVFDISSIAKKHCCCLCANQYNCKKQ
jgi:hypothetical protein